MKFFAIYTLAFLCSMLFAVGKLEVNHYNMEIEEKGTAYTEKIEIDERRNVEIFHVPAHSHINAADYYHDFQMRVTVTKTPTQKICYISTMDPSLSSPEKLKGDIERVRLQHGKPLDTTESSVAMVTGAADRRELTTEILEFCGALPIYKTKHYILDTNNYDSANGTAIIRRGLRRRHARDEITVRDFKSCLEQMGQDELTYVETCQDDNWNLECKMQRVPENCYYFVTCTNNNQPVKNPDWTCTKVHKTTINPFCCDPICP